LFRLSLNIYLLDKTFIGYPNSGRIAFENEAKMKTCGRERLPYVFPEVRKRTIPNLGSDQAVVMKIKSAC
jgi:hypothetical protein